MLSALSAVDDAAEPGSLCFNSAFPGDRQSLASGLSTNHTASLPILAQDIFSFCFVSCTHPGEQLSPLVAFCPQSVLSLLCSLLQSLQPAVPWRWMLTYQECWLSRVLLEMLWLDERCDMLSKWRQKNSALQPSLLHSCYLKRNPLCSA